MWIISWIIKFLFYNKINLFFIYSKMKDSINRGVKKLLRLVRVFFGYLFIFFAIIQLVIVFQEWFNFSHIFLLFIFLFITYLLFPKWHFRNIYEKVKKEKSFVIEKKNPNHNKIEENLQLEKLWNHTELEFRDCPYCAEQIKSNAIKCKHCWSDVLWEEKVKWKIKKCQFCKSNIDMKAKVCSKCWKKQWLWTFGAIVVLVFCLGFFVYIISIISDTGNNNYVSNNSYQENVPKVETWYYTQKENEMTWDTMYFAILNSNNKANFSFPYNWWSTLVLTVRNWYEKWKNEVILKISKWQFLSDRNSIKIRFDDKTAFDVWYNEPADHSSDTIFLKSSSKIIEWLKTAKTMKIEVWFFREWSHVMEFNVEWFNWEH